MRCRYALCLLAALAAETSAIADSISTDRPGNGNAPTTVPEWRLQAELSASVLHDSGTSVLSAPTLVKLGLPANLELRVASGLVQWTLPETGDSDLAATDTAVGAKAQLTSSARGLKPLLGLVVDVSLPTGGDLATADAVVPDARLAAIWQLPARLTVLANLGADVPEDAAGRYTRLIYVANVGYSLAAPLALFVESFGRIDTSGDRTSIVQIDAGAAYLLSDNMQIDFFTQHGVSDAAPTVQAAAGFSFRH